MADPIGAPELATVLADRFTVVTPDRSGRGMSPKDFDAAHEVEDGGRDADLVL